MPTRSAAALLLLAACAATDPELERRLEARAEMGSAVGEASDGDAWQSHGPFEVLVLAEPRARARVASFLATFERELEALLGPAAAPLRVYVFASRDELAAALPRIAGEELEPTMGAYHSPTRSVVCSLEWGLGWLGDLCLRARLDDALAAAGCEPARWIVAGLESLPYNALRAPDGRFQGFSIASYYRPQARELAAAGALVPLEHFLRDEYDAQALTGDALRVQARTVLAWLLARGHLADFVTGWLARCAQDPTGVALLEELLEAPVAELAPQWERWLVSAVGELGPSEAAEPFPVLGVLFALDLEGAPTTRLAGLSPAGPAARAGLRVGDRVLRAGALAVEGLDELLAALRAGSIGRSETLVVERAGEELELEVAFDSLADG